MWRKKNTPTLLMEVKIGTNLEDQYGGSVKN